MFKTLLKGLDEVDAYLRNRVPDPNHVPGTPIPFDPCAMQRPVDPWYTNVYWSVRRWARLIWEAPSEAYYWTRAFFQRGWRGGADRDTWSLSDHLNSFMPDALPDLKETKHGIPGFVFEGLPTENDDGYTHSDESYAI